MDTVFQSKDKEYAEPMAVRIISYFPESVFNEKNKLIFISSQTLCVQYTQYKFYFEFLFIFLLQFIDLSVPCEPPHKINREFEN